MDMVLATGGAGGLPTSFTTAAGSSQDGKPHYDNNWPSILHALAICAAFVLLMPTGVFLLRVFPASVRWVKSVPSCDTGDCRRNDRYIPEHDVQQVGVIWLDSPDSWPCLSCCCGGTVGLGILASSTLQDHQATDEIRPDSPILRSEYPRIRRGERWDRFDVVLCVHPRRRRLHNCCRRSRHHCCRCRCVEEIYLAIQEGGWIAHRRARTTTRWL